MAKPLWCNSFNMLEKLPANAFVNKLLAFSYAAVLPILHYDPAEPYSSFKQLERWSSSCFWGLLKQWKEGSGSYSQGKRDIKTVGLEPIWLKRYTLRDSAFKVGNSTLFPHQNVEN